MSFWEVDTQSVKKDINSDYYEKNFETYNIDKLYSWGKKVYENNAHHVYDDELNDIKEFILNKLKNEI